MHFKDAVVIVTGGARGFGRAFSEALLKRGCKVCFGDVSVAEGEATEKIFQEIYGSDAVLFVKCDVTKDNEFKDLFEHTKTKFGNINVLVNNAGILNEGLPERTVEINLISTLRGTSLAVEHMRKDHGGKGGVVINIASIAGIYPYFPVAAYVASKFGVVGYTRSMAQNPRNGEMGLSFACICPSFCDTAMVGQLRSDNPPVLFWNESKAYIQKMIADGGLMSVDKVVDVFIELLEKENCNGDAVQVTSDGNEYLYRKQSKL